MGNWASNAVVVDESHHNHQDPGPNDSRSPCPLLNTLANHGYLPRDGNNIPSEILQLALQEKVGLGWVAAKALVHLAYKRAGKNGLLSLSDLNYHALESIEHDASLSRLDAALSDNQEGKLNQERFNKFLAFSKDGKSLTTDDVAAARVHFVADSKANNPQVLWNKDIEKRAWAEASVLLHILGKHGTISIEDAKLFFEKETFPPGWQKHPSFGILDLLSATKALQNAAHEHETQPKIQLEDS